jgi:hypothetical protein
MRVLWFWIGRARGQFLACLSEGHAGLAGGGPDVGDRREQRVLPEVVGLPPGDLVQQVRLGPAVQGRRSQDGELQFLVLPSAEAALGQEPLIDALQRERDGPAGAAPVQRVGGQVQEDLAGEGVVARMQGLKLAEQLEDPGPLGPAPSRTRRAVAASYGAGRFLAAIPRP